MTQHELKAQDLESYILRF